MAKLIYGTNMSLDGCIEDEHGSFNWSEPNDELFAFITDFLRPFGTYLYGRRLYEAMAVWETDSTLAVVAFAYDSRTLGNAGTEIAKYYLQLHFGIKKDYRLPQLLTVSNHYQIAN